MARLQLPTTGMLLGRRRHAMIATAKTMITDPTMTNMMATGEYPLVRRPQNIAFGSRIVSTATMKILCESIQCMTMDTTSNGMLKW